MKTHRSGTKLECILPDYYDDRTRIALCPTGFIVIAHPEYPPMYLEDGKLIELKLTERHIPKFKFGSENLDD